MSTTWKYHPPSPITRPIATVVLLDSSTTRQAVQLPGIASRACSSVRGVMPASRRMRT